ncbi:hypothetical protein B0H17DRAFT_1205979 [Mycena rosella]|uniref:Uncharacterized protein n=1 Tax=Mycena rosella TaxID=1033263 RepID=A0AAD7G9P2_MYCRO|nr:hypothetical protein B0H17DRAFT_1205979 [Mycena rosella]
MPAVSQATISTTPTPVPAVTSRPVVHCQSESTLAIGKGSFLVRNDKKECTSTFPATPLLRPDLCSGTSCPSLTLLNNTLSGVAFEAATLGSDHAYSASKFLTVPPVKFPVKFAPEFTLRGHSRHDYAPAPVEYGHGSASAPPGFTKLAGTAQACPIAGSKMGSMGCIRGCFLDVGIIFLNVFAHLLLPVTVHGIVITARL